MRIEEQLSFVTRLSAQGVAVPPALLDAVETYHAAKEAAEDRVKHVKPDLSGLTPDNATEKFEAYAVKLAAVEGGEKAARAWVSAAEQRFRHAFAGQRSDTYEAVVTAFAALAPALNKAAAGTPAGLIDDPGSFARYSDKDTRAYREYVGLVAKAALLDKALDELADNPRAWGLGGSANIPTVVPALVTVARWVDLSDVQDWPTTVDSLPIEGNGLSWGEKSVRHLIASGFPIAPQTRPAVIREVDRLHADRPNWTFGRDGQWKRVPTTVKTLPAYGL